MIFHASGSACSDGTYLYVTQRILSRETVENISAETARRAFLSIDHEEILDNVCRLPLSGCWEGVSRLAGSLKKSISHIP